MTDNQKFIAGVLLGAAAGAALALFLSSDKGKDAMAQVKNIVGDSYDKVKTKASDMVNNVTQNSKERAQQMV